MESHEAIIRLMREEIPRLRRQRDSLRAAIEREENPHRRAVLAADLEQTINTLRGFLSVTGAVD